MVTREEIFIGINQRGWMIVEEWRGRRPVNSPLPWIIQDGVPTEATSFWSYNNGQFAKGLEMPASISVPLASTQEGVILARIDPTVSAKLTETGRS